MSTSGTDHTLQHPVFGAGGRKAPLQTGEMSRKLHGNWRTPYTLPWEMGWLQMEGAGSRCRQKAGPARTKEEILSRTGRDPAAHTFCCLSPKASGTFHCLQHPQPPRRCGSNSPTVWHTKYSPKCSKLLLSSAAQWDSCKLVSNRVMVVSSDSLLYFRFL